MVEREGLSGPGGRGRTSSLAALQKGPGTPVRAADANLVNVAVDFDAGGRTGLVGKEWPYSYRNANPLCIGGGAAATSAFSHFG